jgi:hypothetical protein
MFPLVAADGIDSMICQSRLLSRASVALRLTRGRLEAGGFGEDDHIGRANHTVLKDPDF